MLSTVVILGSRQPCCLVAYSRDLASHHTALLSLHSLAQMIYTRVNYHEIMIYVKYHREK